MIFDYIFYRQDLCFVCKEEQTDNYICPSCLSKLEFTEGRFDLASGRVYYPLFYNNMIKSIIKGFKFEKKTYLVRPLGLILFEFAKNIPDLMDVDFLTYVGMDPVSQFDRGYNQAFLLAEELSNYMNKPIIEIATKVKKTKEQNKSSAKERKSNLSLSYSCKKDLDINGKKVLLIDDLVTTGATLEAVSKCILDQYEVDLKYLTLTSSRIGEEDD